MRVHLLFAGIIVGVTAVNGEAGAYKFETKCRSHCTGPMKCVKLVPDIFSGIHRGESDPYYMCVDTRRPPPTEDPMARMKARRKEKKRNKRKMELISMYIDKEDPVCAETCPSPSKPNMRSNDTLEIRNPLPVIEALRRLENCVIGRCQKGKLLWSIVKHRSNRFLRESYD